MAETVGQRIRDLRKKHNWTQQQLADRINVSSQVISNWERGYTDPDHDDISRLAKTLNTSADYLLFGRTDPDTGQSPVSPEEKEFLDWVKENLDGAFFYDFSKSPEEQKEEMMRGLKLIWEMEKGRKPGQKQGE